MWGYLKVWTVVIQYALESHQFVIGTRVINLLFKMKSETTTAPFRVQKLNDTQAPVSKTTKTWNFNELVRYTIFLHKLLLNKELSKMKMQRRDFQSMAKLVKSRNYNQCRIFHSKMMRIKLNLKDAFQFLSENIKQYSLIYEEYCREEKRSSKEMNLRQEDFFFEEEEEEEQQRGEEREIQRPQPFSELQNILPYARPDSWALHNNQFGIEGTPNMRTEWFQEFDDFMINLQGPLTSWLYDL